LRESVLRAIRRLAKKGLITKDVRYGRLGGRLRGTYWMLAGVAAKDAEAEHKRKQKEARKRKRYEEEFSQEEHKSKPQSPLTTRQASGGEVLNAASAAEKERKRLGLTWRRLLQRLWSW
jgi:predicted DNA-binding WGR domain protein